MRRITAIKQKQLKNKKLWNSRQRIPLRVLAVSFTRAMENFMHLNSAQIEQASIVWVLVANGAQAQIYQYHKNKKMSS